MQPGLGSRRWAGFQTPKSVSSGSGKTHQKKSEPVARPAPFGELRQKRKKRAVPVLQSAGPKQAFPNALTQKAP